MMAGYRGGLAIAIGNPLRHDDGVARRVLESLGEGADIETRFVLQLTPEIADTIAGYSVVVFIDAHVNAKYPVLEPVKTVYAPFPLTHVASPAELVAVARAIFAFSGHAYICRMPASDFSEGEGLSQRSDSFVKQAVREIEGLFAAL
jgi:Ni,Fe-hydrogenase maturation factor